MEEPEMRTSAIVGDTIRIVEMKGEPQYAGKIGIVTNINPAYPPLGILEQWHGTWGGCAIQPEHDTYEILEHA